MIETHTRILGIAPYDGMRTAMEQAAQAYPNVEMDIYTGDLEDGQAIVQQMPPNSYDCIISRGGTAALIRQVTDLPVVDIHISVYDVLRTMKRPRIIPASTPSWASPPSPSRPTPCAACWTSTSTSSP